MSIASLENNAFQSNGQVLIDPDQGHSVHLKVHLQFAGQAVQAVQQQQTDPRMVATVMRGLIPHVLTHLKFMSEDPTRKQEYEEINVQVSELMKIADQLNQMAEKMQEQEQAQAQQQQGQQAQTPQQLVAMNKIQLDQAKFQNDAKIKQAKAQHQMMLQDKKTAQRLMIDKIKVASKYPTLGG